MVTRILLLGICSLAIGTRTAAETRFVAADGSGAYPNIQAAVTASTHGDVIELGDGVFKGTGNRALFLAGRRITLRSASGDPRTCIIDAEHAAQVLRMFNEPPETVIENIALVNGTSTDVGGIVYAVSLAQPTFRGCIIAGGRAERGGGVFASGYGITLESCWILDNDGTDGGGGVLVTGGAEATLDGCVIAGNRAGGFGGAGLWVGDNASATLARTTIALNETPAAGGGLFVHAFSTVEVSRSILWGNDGGEGDDIHVWDLSCDVIAGCSVVDPAGIGGYDGVVLGDDVIAGDPLFCTTPVTFASWAPDAFALEDGSPSLPANNACGELMGARPSCDGGTPTRRISWGALKSRF